MENERVIERQKLLKAFSLHTSGNREKAEELYQKMDLLIGEIQQYLNEDDLLMIISDHGFSSFKWGVNLNSWLYKEGYLVLKEDSDMNEK